ncbi:MAG: hypothetical protein EBS00_07730, partial [Verrucomicrobia bacterium]|nr:hypothetical protein [Verrucomicrobiota bacterium]
GNDTTGLNFARNTTVSSDATITSDRLTTGPGVTHTLGTLSIGAQTLTTARGSNASTGTGGITFGATTLTGNATLSTGANTNLTLGAIGESGGTGFNLTKSGSGTLTLSGANTSTGTTNITAGTLTLGASGALSSGNLTLASGATLDTSAKASGLTLGNNVTFNASGTLVGTSGQAFAMSSTGGSLVVGGSGNIGTFAVTAGNLTLAGNTTIELGASSAKDVINATTVNSQKITLGGTLTLAASGTATAGLYTGVINQGSAAGTAFSGANNFSGLTQDASLTALGLRGQYTRNTNSVDVALYNLASAAATQTVNVGAYRVGASKSGTASITNASAVNATYTEQLATGTITPGTGATSSGSFSGVAGGSSGNITVGLGTASTAGAKSGTVTVGLNSTAVNSSGLDNQAITSQVITVNGAAYDTANAGYATTTKAFGNVRVGSSPAQQTVSFTNNAITNASYQDSLDVSGSKTNSKITLGNGFNVAAGASA